MKKIFNIACASILFGLFAFGGLIKLSFMWGSKYAFFSWSCMLAPILGGVLGIAGASSVLMSAKFFKFFALGRVFSVLSGIPTLFASWCWAAEYGDRKITKFFVNCVVPVICFVLFIIHPSVGYGFFFGLYWFIPVIIFLFQKYGLFCNNVFCVALKSTFVAHAVGSVLWCYTVPMSPDKWLALIPVVAIERLVFASGMVVLFRVLFYASKIASFSRNLRCTQRLF